MFRKAKNGYYEFEEFKKFKGLIHGFSTREFGDCRTKTNNFLVALGLEKENLVLAKQVHGNKIKVVKKDDRGKIIPNVDGLLTDQPGEILGVKTADCLPILFFEPEAKIIGVAHAGWRGVLARLPQKMIDQITRMGGLPKNLLVGIGPHICDKCYPVEKTRSQSFLAEFGKLEGMVGTGKKADFLDLAVPVQNQLIHSAVLPENILLSSSCTSCQSKEFFSYRKDSKKTYGEMLSIISLIKNTSHVHFVGIGGSGLAGVAILAKNQGFRVSGCDLAKETYYLNSLKKAGIKPLVGHDAKHLKGVDILAVTPAVLDINPDHPEIVEAKKRKILMTWQEFMGKYLQKGKFVVAVAGTHGKSTTTALTGLVLESGGLDPIVEVGAIVPEWQATARAGKSKYFVCEADEFNYNFLPYSPSVIIINNIEMDHPEFFKNLTQFRGAFKKFIQKIQKPKILIVNEESQGIQQLLKEMKLWLKEKKVKVIGYFINKSFRFPFAAEYQGRVSQIKPEFTRFMVANDFGQKEFQLKIPGIHNVANALGVIACASFLKIKPAKINQALSRFNGLARRFDLVGENKGIKVLDDYAVHPTAVVATLRAAKQKYPRSKIWAIFEPHQFSRLYLFLKKFASALDLADKVVVTKIYAGREKDMGKIKAGDLIKKIGAKAKYIKDFEDLANYIAVKARKNDVIVVFGAGKSYLISKMIVERLND